MKSNKRFFNIQDIIFKNMDWCTNYLKTFKNFWYLTLLGKKIFYTFLVTLLFFFSFCELLVASHILGLWNMSKQM